MDALRLTVDRRDGHSWVSVLAMLGIAAALAMAITGLPPVDLHGPLHKFGIMDPLCGGTRAARYAAQGNFVEAWRYNPLSIVIVVAGGVALVRAGIGIVAGRWVNLKFSPTQGQRRILLGVVAVLLMALEIRQQMRAELLMEGTQTWR